jgi:hypothetical protein
VGPKGELTHTYQYNKGTPDFGAQWLLDGAVDEEGQLVFDWEELLKNPKEAEGLHLRDLDHGGSRIWGDKIKRIRRLDRPKQLKFKPKELEKSGRKNFGSKFDFEKYKKERKKKDESFEKIFAEHKDKSETEKAYLALKQSAKLFRGKQDPAATEKWIQKGVEELPPILPTGKKIKIGKKTGEVGIAVSKDTMKDVLTALSESTDNFLIEADAKQALAKELYNQPYYYQLDKKKKAHINYLIRKHAAYR